MDATARKDAIIKIMTENNTVKILQLSNQLHVTRETIRRDLYDLEKQHLVKMVRGGAILNAPVYETKYEKRLHVNAAAKKSIAKRFCDYVEAGDTIYLDYGTTSYFVAKELANFKNINVITNSLPIIEELYRHEDIHVIVLGGFVRSNEGSLYGELSNFMLERLNINIGFFSGSGLNVEFGLSNHHVGESELTRTVASHCQSVIVGLDHSKFGSVFINHILSLDQIDTLITDQLTDRDLIKQLRGLTDLQLVDQD